ncbi:hypothetical protein EW026_g2576 [Hermanssonia centrifuga]|uniref:DUF6534 domain-containing protein n=1 Tax=Hermanssonia centrifuga TaxID=98765 RepID=A0A4S4KNS4_9APHY|nr:hypothetical protein EW026_g2576 [Hermanssonia centrifuga]
MAPNTQTYGALLIGGLVAMFLSGIVSTQVFLYFRNYPGDRLRNRTMVSTVWILDLLHAGFVCASVWRYLIHGFQDDTYILSIAWTVSVTVSITGFLTFLVHCFFTHRVWTLSRHNDTGVPKDEKSRTGFSSMDQIIDSIMVYTIENGFLTSIVAVASLICWLTMPGNFIFLALHFAITKLYANSLLATLNARTHLKEPSHSSAEHYNSYRLPTLFSSRSIRKDTSQGDPQANNTTNTLQINVEKSVHYVTDIGSADLDSVEPAYLPRRASSSTDSPFTDLATPYKS